MFNPQIAAGDDRSEVQDWAVRRQEAPRRERHNDGRNDGSNEVGGQRPVPAEGYKAPREQRIRQEHRDQAQEPPRSRGVRAACAGTKQKNTGGYEADNGRRDKQHLRDASHTWQRDHGTAPFKGLRGSTPQLPRNGSPVSSMCRPSQSVRLFAQAMPPPPPT